MGIISKGLSAFLRFMAFVSSVIVAGLLGRFVHHEHKMGLSGGSRTLFVLSLSGISIFFSLLLMIPFAFTFWAFPLDFAMFVMWIVGFGILAGRDRRCKGPWHTWVWSFSWGRSRCGIWRSVLAFTFIAAMCWLASMLLGMYRSFRGRHKEAATAATAEHGGKKRGLFGRKKAPANQPMAESGQAHGQTQAHPAVANPDNV